jgi:hypothetical protein
MAEWSMAVVLKSTEQAFFVSVGTGEFGRAYENPPQRVTVWVTLGTHGFAREYVKLAVEPSRGGVLAVAAC